MCRVTCSISTTSSQSGNKLPIFLSFMTADAALFRDHTLRFHYQQYGYKATHFYKSDHSDGLDQTV